LATQDRDEQRIFETEVQRIARELWPDAQYSGSSIVDGRERDGVFETEECVHLVEATVSRSRDKALDDGKKLTALARKLQQRHTDKAVKCWFVTRDEPTADQRDALTKHHSLVHALSFAQFQSKLIDVPAYLSQREHYPFGSIRDPATGHTEVQVEYVELDLTEVHGGKLWTLNNIRDALIEGRRLVALGDYGAGKSMTLRQVFKDLRKAYFNKKTTKFPIYLNLRDHFGQANPAEVLERHARNVGFAHPAHLVRAWRAGYVILLLDGFDELTTSSIQGLWKRLQDTRFRAVQAVREFVRSQRQGSGILIAGRAHFFDSERERRSALSLGTEAVELNLNEFTEGQIEKYLARTGLKGSVPSWLPSRPLLVGYLASSGILGQALGANQKGETDHLGSDPAKGWDLVLDKVCDREAEIEAGIDGPTVRRILERLATTARSCQSGLGPLTTDQVISAFVDVCGYQPDEKGLVLLQRLPGLGIDRADEGTRSFLDAELADACRAGDVIRFVMDPFGANWGAFRGAEVGLTGVGVGLCVVNAQKQGLNSGKVNIALKQAADAEDLAILTVDLVRVCLEMGYGVESHVRIKDVFIPALELSYGENDCSKVEFKACFFSSVAIDPDVIANRLPRFSGSYIDEIEGRASIRDLPAGAFDSECRFERFSEAPETTDAISRMDLPLGSKVLLTILKKIYLQSGSGRKENALHRGLDHHARRLVPGVLRLLQAEGLASPYRRGGLDMTIWVPDRAHTSRVGRLIASPRTCGDPLLVKAETLS
jgi:hypothetical protein